MSAYESLAFSYDSLTRDIPYEEMLSYMEALLQKHGIQPQSVLDLACGTGSMSVLLAQKGYQVLAADLSEDMLAMAWEKAAELENLEECYNFFVDLCTVSEMKAMEQRYEVAKLLNQGMIYNDILEQTGASSATISRVNRSLNYGTDTYRVLFARLQENREDEA